jgi:hypothetical protein
VYNKYGLVKKSNYINHIEIPINIMGEKMFLNLHGEFGGRSITTILGK